MIHRFYIENFKKLKDSLLVFEKEKIFQIRKVLRKKEGSKIIFFDNFSKEYLCQIKKIGKNFLEAQILEISSPQREPEIKIFLYQALLKRKKFEMVLKYSVGFGVEKIIPIISERTIVRKISPKKLDRWKKIIIESCEQSQRVKIPQILPPIEFKKAIEETSSDLKLIAHPSSKNSLKEILKKKEKPGSLSLFIGPEGGFSENEINLARSLGFFDFKIQDLVLFSEVASLAVISQILFYYS